MYKDLIILFVGAFIGYYSKYFWQKKFTDRGKKEDLQFETKSEIYTEAYDCHENLKKEPMFHMYVLFNNLGFYKAYGQSLDEINSLTRKINISLTIDEAYRSKALQFATDLLNVLLLSRDASKMTKSSEVGSGEKLEATMTYFNTLHKDLITLRDLSK